MKKKKIFRTIFIMISILISIVIAIAYFLPITLKFELVEQVESLSPETILNVEQVREDREEMIKFVEDVHPYFIDGSDLSLYEKSKNDYIDATQKEMSVGDFMLATSQYITFFGDAHTSLWWWDDSYLNIEHEFSDGKMYVSGTDNSFNQYVTAIDDVDVRKIFETIDKLAPAENEMGQYQNYNDMFNSKVVLGFAGVDVDKDSFMIHLNDNKSYTCGYCDQSEPDFSENEETNEDTNSCFMDGDVFVVNFASCQYDEGYKKVCKELEEAIKSGCSKVIIDVRNNGGGDSNTCEDLLKAMGMSAPSYGMLVRYSPEAKKQDGYFRSSGKFYSKGSINCRKNENVKLVVLSSRNTFSSATMMCVFVRDGGHGIIIGEPSSNMPNSYGDIVCFSLSNSHLYGSVSHKKFERPDGSNKERMLVPDIETKINDAYDEAMRYLSGNKED